jgi:8-oxo-dGTP pyrophosphatase MutT (NUDIX family)
MLKPQVFSSGYIIFRKDGGRLQFLLMQHPDRWDLPKGHHDDGETPEEAAMRELVEETGLPPTDIITDRDFKYIARYSVGPSKRDGKTKVKELTIYLGWLTNSRDVVVSEHSGHCWFDWLPPHHIQSQTIDPLLEQVEAHLERFPDWPEQLSMD